MIYRSLGSLVAFMFVIALVAGACDSGGSPPAIDDDPNDDGNDPVSLVVEILEAPDVLRGIGSTATLLAIVRTEDGTDLPDSTVTWTSSDANVVAINADGGVDAVGFGMATVRASFGSTFAEHDVKVIVDAPDFIAGGVVAVTGVDVVRPESGLVDENETVLVDNGTITRVGPVGSVSVPGGAQVIDGAGLFVMPGLADMHTHVNFSTAPDTRSVLSSYLSQGVTTILVMGDMNGLGPATRQQVEDGLMPGPTMFVSHFARGPNDGGQAFTIANSPAQGSQLVREAVSAGYDFIKVYNDVTRATFDAIVAEADVQGVSVIGHGVRDPGMNHIVENGLAMVAHAEEFIYTTFGFQVNESAIPGLVDLLRANGTWVTPTLSTYETIAWMLKDNQDGKNGADRFLDRPGAEYLHSARRDAWVNFYNSAYTSSADIFPRLRFQQTFVKAFADAGIPLMTGTDSPSIPGMVPGFSLHDELRLLQEAGLSRTQVLTAATEAPGRFIVEHVSGATPFGQITPGYSADLVLLTENPLEDLDAARENQGVMVRGRWFGRQTLQSMLNGE